MKWGRKYGPEYVNVLQRMVARHLSGPHRFVCFTDDPAGIRADIDIQPMPSSALPNRPSTEAWRKITLFKPGLGLQGQVLFLDLDVAITGSLDPFFEHPGTFCIIHNWTHPDRRVGNSSVFRFEAGAHAHVFERFNADPDWVVENFRNEQIYVSAQIDEAVGLTWWPAPWCRSFKKHCMGKGLLRMLKTPRLPEGCRILVFHGSPNPPEAATQWRYGERKGLKPPKVKPPAKWILDYWKE
jgi:hypothetical protein